MRLDIFMQELSYEEITQQKALRRERLTEVPAGSLQERSEPAEARAHR